MKLTYLPLLGLSLAQTAFAVGNAVVQNNCNAPVYLWSVGGSVSDRVKIDPGDGYAEAFRHDPASGGVSLKITRTENGLYDGSPQMNYAYTLDGDKVWYDLSDIFGDPFEGHAVGITPNKQGCPGICWPNGVSTGGSQVKTCSANGDVVLTVCKNKC